MIYMYSYMMYIENDETFLSLHHWYFQSVMMVKIGLG